MSTMPGYLLFWLVLLALAISNGIVREATFGHSLPELQSHQLSTITGMLLTGAAVWALASLWKAPASIREALMIGLVWTAFTVTFEFLFGHFVAGHSWDTLLQDYHLLNGRVWLLFLAWIFILPYAAFSFLVRP